MYHMPLATGEKGVTDVMKDLEADKGSARLTSVVLAMRTIHLILLCCLFSGGFPRFEH